MFHFFQYDAYVICTALVCATLLVMTRKLWMKG